MVDYRKNLDGKLHLSPQQIITHTLDVDPHKYTTTLQKYAFILNLTIFCSFMETQISRNVQSNEKQQVQSMNKKIYYMPQNKQSYMFGGKTNIRDRLNIEVEEKQSIRPTTSSSMRTAKQKLAHRTNIANEPPVAVKPQSRPQSRQGQNNGLVDDLTSMKSFKSRVSAAVNTSQMSQRRQLQIADQRGSRPMSAQSRASTTKSIQRRPLAEEIDSNMKTYYPQNYNQFMRTQALNTQNIQNGIGGSNLGGDQRLQRSQSQFKIKQMGTPLNQRQVQLIDKLITMNNGKPFKTIRTFKNEGNDLQQTRDDKLERQSTFSNLYHKSAKDLRDQQIQYLNPEQEDGIISYEQDIDLKNENTANIDQSNFNDEERDQVQELDIDRLREGLSQKDFDEIRSYAQASRQSVAPSQITGRSKRSYITQNNNNHHQLINRSNKSIQNTDTTSIRISQITSASKVDKLEKHLQYQMQKNNHMEQEIENLRKLTLELQSKLQNNPNSPQN
ncbi:UNKNOWN [Stylonychia lemnae]|uniref:Uncharacterized protein n=1 Tax=Stylonychia lemnae TaxID=5949 RepID=A0A078BBY6_STYLE|nr:UNKNOWN [Stylonychia lemnae]|eukprot:CDW90767.1 UNKNOWN [Stylonychia lemnae]